MGLIRDFLKSKKEQKQTSLSLEEENRQLKEQIKTLEVKIKEIEYEHSEELAYLDREFLTWYSKQNTTNDLQNNALNSKISELNREQDKQEALDLETKTEDLEIGDLIND